MNYVITFCSYLVIFQGFTFAQENEYDNSICEESSPGSRCTKANKCNVARKAINTQNGNHNLVGCGFDKFDELVCCPRTSCVGFGCKSKEKCIEYRSNFANIARPNYQIWNGRDASVGEFPETVALGFYSTDSKQYRFDCGGTIISENFVVTAAHCIANIAQNKLEIVRVGTLEVPSAVDQPDWNIDVKVKAVKLHKQYQRKKHLNDIALVQLEKSLRFGENILPACLYTDTNDPAKFVAAGWGAIDQDGTRKTTLQKTVLYPRSLPKCNSTYIRTRSTPLSSRQLCASATKTDACEGDSGGPLLRNDGGVVASLAGIISFGSICGSTNPGVYTKISSYVDWIEDNVW